MKLFLEASGNPPLVVSESRELGQRRLSGLLRAPAHPWSKAGAKPARLPLGEPDGGRAPALAGPTAPASTELGA